MTYDQWKTRSPDDRPYEPLSYRDLFPRDDDEEDYCEHPYWHTRHAFVTGKATCGQCGAQTPWCEPVPFVDRLLTAWFDLSHWWRFTAMWEIKRPWRAVRSWWRGCRAAPWMSDNDLPF